MLRQVIRKERAAGVVPQSATVYEVGPAFMMPGAGVASADLLVGHPARVLPTCSCLGQAKKAGLDRTGPISIAQLCMLLQSRRLPWVLNIVPKRVASDLRVGNMSSAVGGPEKHGAAAYKVHDGCALHAHVKRSHGACAVSAAAMRMLLGGC